MRPPLENIIIAFRGEARRKGFTQIPTAVLLDHTLSHPAVRLYGLLVAYAMQAEGSVVSQQEIAQDLDCTDRSIRNWMAELETHKLVTVYRQGLNKPNVYLIEDAYALYDQEKPRRRKGKTTERKAGSGPDRNADSCSERKNGSGPGGTDFPLPLHNNNRENNSLTKNESEDEDARNALSDSPGRWRIVYRQGIAQFREAVKAAQQRTKPPCESPALGQESPRAKGG